jgi:transcriptional regulator with XRE-family HTH domain
MSTTPYAKLLRYLRDERGLTQTEVAKRLKLSRASYLALERGSRELTLREALVATALYGITIEHLIHNTMPDYEKYQMMVRAFLRLAQAEKVALKKTKLAQLLYLADMRTYFETKKSMSGMTYRHYEFGPAADAYFRLVEEMELRGDISITQVARENYHMYEIKESRGSARQPLHLLTKRDTDTLTAVFHAWRDASTAELTKFIMAQAPLRETSLGEEIPYELIRQEAPHLVS